MQKITLVVPSISTDISTLLLNLEIYFRMLPINKICIIGSRELKALIPNDDRLTYIDENSIIDFNRVETMIIHRTGNKNNNKRTGWYVQQLIKIGYCKTCTDEYYLLWDSDTIPVKHVELFDGKKPIFYLKTEYHKPYFDAISKLLPNCKKKINMSFIAEHMLINTEMMKNMIISIESNNNIEGRDYIEKIINAINLEDLPKCGFSEFETYGTYVLTNYPEMYKLRSWKSFRFGGFFFENSKDFKDKEVNWISQKYDAVSIEKRDYISKLRIILPLIENVFQPDILEYLSIVIRGYRKLIGKR